MPWPFLTAYWSNLIVCNYEIAPEILQPYLPAGTELDLFQNKAFISVIAFHFQDTKFLGAFPTFPAVHFEEINLRFYVRRTVNGEVRRGVVFIKEVVPSRFIALVARTLYNEPYQALPMSRDDAAFHPKRGGRIAYIASHNDQRIEVSATTRGEQQPLKQGSVEHFILEHYWGYTGRENYTTSEYRVAHPSWQYWATESVSVSPQLLSLYPEVFHSALQKPPHSTFVACGSPVSVYTGRRFRPTVDVRHAPTAPANGWMLYDAQCGFCSWWAAICTRLAARAGFTVAALQDEWAQKTLRMPRDQTTNDIRVIKRDGTLLSGVDAYLCIFRQVWWLTPLAAMVRLPGFYRLTTRLYQIINRSRFRISRACNLKPDRPEEQGQT
jgi:uncharacterized protein YqjF (DUF2071 family)/predicted DCC family thiol-disulfide oxidoreductase YuxK